MFERYNKDCFVCLFLGTPRSIGRSRPTRTPWQESKSGTPRQSILTVLTGISSMQQRVVLMQKKERKEKKKNPPAERIRKRRETTSNPCQTLEAQTDGRTFTGGAAPRSQTPAPLSPSWQPSKGLHSFSLEAGVGEKNPSEKDLRGSGRQAVGERNPPQSQSRNERRDLLSLARN